MQNVQHLFMKGAGHSRAAFFTFAKSATPEAAKQNLEILITCHLKSEKFDAFLTYWHEHEGLSSAQCAIESSLMLLDTNIKQL